MIAQGSYHIVLPEVQPMPRAGFPALMMLHGWGGSGQGMMDMHGMLRSALDHGYAVIAPDGVPRAGRNGRTWAFHPDRPGPRDEITFLEAIRDDAASRHGIDAGRVVLAGFSIGGSMVSYAACAAPEAFMAYAPVAGTFWQPVPATCSGPVDLLHTHGWTDGVVPLEGRRIDGGDVPATMENGSTAEVMAQGDVWQAMQVWRAANGCPSKASATGNDGAYWWRRWQDCGSGKRLGVVLFNGGHAVPPGWATMVIDWVEAER